MGITKLIILSSFLLLWKLFMIALIYWDFIFGTFALSFNYYLNSDKLELKKAIFWITIATLSIDILLNFHTSYSDKGRNITEIKKIAKCYAQSVNIFSHYLVSISFLIYLLFY